MSVVKLWNCSRPDVFDCREVLGPYHLRGRRRLDRDAALARRKCLDVIGCANVLDQSSCFVSHSDLLKLETNEVNGKLTSGFRFSGP